MRSVAGLVIQVSASLAEVAILEKCEGSMCWCWHCHTSIELGLRMVKEVKLGMVERRNTEFPHDEEHGEGFSGSNHGQTPQCLAVSCPIG